LPALTFQRNGCPLQEISLRDSGDGFGGDYGEPRRPF